QAINKYMASCFHLFQTGDLDSAKPQWQLPTSSYKYGDVLLSGLGGPGLGTIPAGKGPIGMHLLLMPLDMQDWLSIAFALLSHESRHQIFSDVKGMEEELQSVLKNAISRAVNGGGIKLSGTRTRLGRYTVDTSDLLIKLMADCIGEIDADLSGGLL